MCLNDYLSRLNWEDILNFIAYGAGNEKEKNSMIKSSLSDRINDYEKKYSKNITDFANAIHQQQELSEAIIDELSEQLIIAYGKSKDVYLELGLKIGFLLTMELLYM